MSEVFPLVDPEGNVLGSACREQCHANPDLLHPVIHCVIINSRGQWLLQKRSVKKDIQPGRWDTSVGGHVSYGEEPAEALVREVSEEVGIRINQKDCRFLYTYINRSEIETELVYSWLLRHEGPFIPQESEVDELRFWPVEQIEAAITSGEVEFTPNFIEEFRRVQAHGRD